MSEKLIFPIGFDLEEGVKEASKEWKSTYQKQLQKAIDDKPLKAKIELETKGLDLGMLKEFNKISKEMVAASKTNAKIQRDNIAVQERQRLANERVAAAHERTLAAAARRQKAERGLTNEYKTQGGYLQRLFQRMVAYASVIQAFSFIRNIREVTAQFELQRVALGSIIGDLNEANAMFEQIKAAAVKSPFQIKELVTYTKQLASYKIETDELFETTQKLADVSAGLGVGMERLVLAYGQIRATGYLRASEVRQLTEAGIPIVEELAKKMSDLRGETVSAADVMQLISERAISFGMVKDVFDDMTSAGGMFYKMQEKQAETLAGQWSNLRDSISIMYEEIGNTEGVNNAMKGLIGLVKSLAENWRTIGIVVGGTLGSFLAMRGVSKMLPDISNYAIRSAKATRQYNRALREMRIAIQNGDRALIGSARSNLRYAVMMRNAEKATTAFGRGLKRLWATLVANPWTAILTALSALASALYSAYENATRLDKELASIESRGALEGDQQVRNFERLADVVKSSVNGSKQQTDAIKELKRSYGDFLPMQDEEIRKLLSTEGGYRAVSSAIREKIALQTLEQKINATTSAFGEDISDIQDDIRKRLIDEGLSRDEVSRFFAELENAIKDGVTDIKRELPKIFNKATKLDWDFFKIRDVTTGAFSFGNIMTLIDLLTDYEEKIKDIDSEMQASLGALDAYNQKYQELQKTLSELSSDKPKDSFEWNEDIRAQQIMEYWIFIKDLIREAREQEGLSQKDYEHLLGLEDFNEVFKILENKVPAMAGIVRKLRNEWAELMPTSMTQSINAQIISIAKTMSIPMDKVQTLLKQNSEDYATWAQRLKGIFDKSKGDVVAWRNTLNAALSFNTSAISNAQGELNSAEDWAEFLKALNNAFQFSDGNNSRSSRQKDAWVSKMEERIKYMQDFQRGVESLAKTMPRDAAIIREQMIMLNRGVSLGLEPKTMQGSTEELIAWYQKAIEDTQKRLQRYTGFRGLSVEQILSKKTQNKTIQEMQSLLQSLYNALTDFETDQVAREMEKKLKDLSDNLSRTKTAKEFFDRMLGMTGDKELSATLTLSVYGTTGDDIKSALVKQIQGAFAGQDLSKAINTDLNSIDLSALREIYNNLPEDFQEQQKKAMKQVLDMLEKGQKDLASNFAKLLMDYDEMEQKRVTITQKATQEIATLEQGLQAQIESILQNKEITDKDSTIAQVKARAESVRKAILAREKLELSKLSPEYIRFFSSINAMAMETANSTRTQLRRALFDAFEQGGISAEELRKELKAIDTQFNKLNENASIFASYITGGFDSMIAKLRESADELDAIAARMKNLKSLDQMNEDDANFVNKMLNVFGGEGQKSLSDLAASFNGDMSKMGEAVQQVGGEMQGMFSSAAGAISIVDMIIRAVHQSVEAIKQVIDQINSMRSEDNQIGGWFDYISDFDKYAFSGWERLKSGDVMGAMADTASSIISIFQNIQSDKIEKIDKSIEKLEITLDDLSYAYGRLQKAQEEVFGSEYISNYERRLENLQAQQEAYLKQADLERSKGKKADEGKIREYEEQARDTADAIKEMYGSLSEHFLGQDLASAARDFANAWIDAYKEFSNTTDAMKAKFQDMIRNMVVESLLAKVMEKALEPVFTMIDEMGDSDFYSTSFWQRVMSTMQTATENGVVGAQNVMSMLEQMGVNLRGLGGEMTGISRDIATASEESILGLAAGINTQNFYISQVPTKLDTIIGLLRGEGVIPQGSAITLQDVMIAQNQFLSHLPTIAQHTAETVAECKQIVVETRRTADALDRVIKPDGTRTTYKMNVVTSYQG